MHTCRFLCVLPNASQNHIAVILTIAKMGDVMVAAFCTGSNRLFYGLQRLPTTADQWKITNKCIDNKNPFTFSNGNYEDNTG